MADYAYPQFGDKEPKKLKFRLTLLEEMLGMSPADPEIYDTYIVSKAMDSKTGKQTLTEEQIAEELEAVADETLDKAMTVFPRDKDGFPCLWDYQIKGLFKDAGKALRKIPGSKSSGMKTYKAEIDKLIYVFPRMIPIIIPDGMTISDCQRPLRASTPQGDRVALACSETVPVGSSIEFEVVCLVPSDMDTVLEWLNFGQLNGLGQWRNSGKGRFTYEIID